MADSDTLRKRRYRHHMAGDHGLCIPGRCKALDSSVDIQPVSNGPLVTALRDALAAADLPPMMKPLAIEAVRTAERLDTLDRQLAGHDWLRFRTHDDVTEVTVYVDRVLAEAREQGVAFRGLVAELEKGTPKAEPGKKGGGVLADLAARRAARSGTTAG